MVFVMSYLIFTEYFRNHCITSLDKKGNQLHNIWSALNKHLRNKNAWVKFVYAW